MPWSSSKRKKPSDAWSTKVRKRASLARALVVSAATTSDVVRNAAMRTTSSTASMRSSNNGGEKKKFRQAAPTIESATDVLKLPSSETSAIRITYANPVLARPKSSRKQTTVITAK